MRFIILPMASFEAHGFEHVKDSPIGDAATLEEAMKVAHALGGGTIYPEAGENGGPIQWKDMVQGVIPGTIAAKVHGLEAEDEAIGEEAGAKEA